MKIFNAVWLCVFICFVGSFLHHGCKQQVSKEDILKSSDRIYTNMRIIATSQAIGPLLSEETKEELAKLEIKYLEVVAILQKEEIEINIGDGKIAVDALFELSNEVLFMLSSVVTDDHPKYVQILSGIQLAVDLMEANLK